MLKLNISEDSKIIIAKFCDKHARYSTELEQFRLEELFKRKSYEEVLPYYTSLYSNVALELGGELKIENTRNDGHRFVVARDIISESSKQLDSMNVKECLYLLSFLNSKLLKYKMYIKLSYENIHSRIFSDENSDIWWESISSKTVKEFKGWNTPIHSSYSIRYINDDAYVPMTFNDILVVENLKSYNLYLNEYKNKPITKSYRYYNKGYSYDDYYDCFEEYEIEYVANKFKIYGFSEVYYLLKFINMIEKGEDFKTVDKEDPEHEEIKLFTIEECGSSQRKM